VNLRPLAASSALALVLASAVPAAPQPALTLGPGDLRIEQRDDGGYHLYVRARDGLGSILLTESTKDPTNKSDSYAFRSLGPNPVNDGESRILDGKKLPITGEHRYLVDSSPESDAAFGRAFHIFIPWVVAWGHSWSRGDKVYIHDGTFINIRAFAKPFADYSGPFVDNPYLVRVTQAPKPRPVETPAASAPAATDSPGDAPGRSTVRPGQPELSRYYPETLASFGSLAEATKGELRYASSDSDIIPQIDAIISRATGKSLDFVLCVDVTDSMMNGVDELKAKLPELLRRRAGGFAPARFGIVAYKDYFEEYLYKRLGFETDLGAFSDDLNSLTCGGGRDIPEAVYEGVYAALTEFPWAAESRIVVLVGDAPPHPFPRGSVAESDVLDAAAEAAATVYPVAVPK